LPVVLVPSLPKREDKAAGIAVSAVFLRYFNALPQVPRP